MLWREREREVSTLTPLDLNQQALKKDRKTGTDR